MYVDTTYVASSVFGMDDKMRGESTISQRPALSMKYTLVITRVDSRDMDDGRVD